MTLFFSPIISFSPNCKSLGRSVRANSELIEDDVFSGKEFFPFNFHLILLQKRTRTIIDIRIPFSLLVVVVVVVLQAKRLCVDDVFFFQEFWLTINSTLKATCLAKRCTLDLTYLPQVALYGLVTGT